MQTLGEKLVRCFVSNCPGCKKNEIGVTVKIVRFLPKAEGISW